MNNRDKALEEKIKANDSQKLLDLSSKKTETVKQKVRINDIIHFDKHTYWDVFNLKNKKFYYFLLKPNDEVIFEIRAGKKLDFILKNHQK